MKNNILISFISSILVLFLCSCQPVTPINNQAPSIFAEYAVRFLENEQQLRGQAFFAQGDSITNLTPMKIEGGVSFMGSGMNARPLPNGTIRYETTLNGSLPQPIRFGFKLAGDKEPRSVDFNMSLVGDFTVVSASKTKGVHIKLSSPLLDRESNLLLFTDPNGEARTIIRPGPLQDLNLFLPSDALLHFIPGAYSVYIVKSKTIEEIESGVDFQANIEYYSKEVKFVLEE